MQIVSISNVAFSIAPYLFLVAVDTIMDNAVCINNVAFSIAPYLFLVAMDTIMNNAGRKYQ